MKITKSMRILVLLLVAAMVFSLFSCADLIPTDETSETESVTTKAPKDDETEPEATEPEGTTPEATEPEGTTPEATEPEDTTPKDTTPEDTTPKDTTPEDTTPEDTTPAGCDHVWDEGVITDPTCEEDGAVFYTCTLGCGETKTETIDALGHAYPAEPTTTKDATCEEDGLKTYVCTNGCGVDKTEVIDALGHDWDNADCTVPKTCNTCGETEGAALGHTWADATCTAPKTCDACGATEGEALGHTWVDADCDTPKTCSVCGETEGEALGHAYPAEPTATKDATCEEDGLKTYVCANGCGVDKTEVIEALGHDWDEGVVTKTPTCVEQGTKIFACKTDSTHQKTENVDIDPNNHVEGTKVVKCTVVCAGCEAPVEGEAKQHGAFKTNAKGEAICTECNENVGPTEAIFGANGFDAYFSAEHICGVTVASHGAVLNDDGSVRYEGNGNAWEKYVEFFINENNTAVLGQYMVIKYKTNITDPNYTKMQIYASTKTKAPSEIAWSDIKVVNLNRDGEWHIVVVDLASGTYAAGEEGFAPIYIRIDPVDPTNAKAEYNKLPEGQWVDIAYIAVCDDTADVAAYMAANEGETELCAHNLKVINEKCVECCAGCGEVYAVKHITTETYEDDAVTHVRTFTAVCNNCHETIYTYNVQLGEEAPNFFVPASSLAQMRDPFQMGGAELAADGSYVTFKNNTAASQNGGEAHFMAIKNGDATSPTGQYLMIKYRTTYNAGWEVFIAANNGHTSATGGDNFTISAQSNGINNGVVADGEWHVVIIDLATLAKPWGNIKPEDGTTDTYLVDYMRFDIFNTKSTSNQTVDIAYIAIADDLQKLVDAAGTDYYIYCDSYKSGTVGYPINTISGNPYFSASLIGKKANVSVLKDADNNGMPYVQFKPAAGDGEKNMMLWSDTTYKLPNGGKYLGILYRVNGRTDNDWFDFFINSTNTGAQGGFSASVDPAIYGGAWRFGLVSLQGIINKAGTDATVYYDPATGIASIRFDFSNRGGRGENVTIDVAFVAFFESESEALAYFADYAQTYFADTTCKHEYVGEWNYFDNGDESDKAMQKADCIICGKENAVRRVAPIGTTLEIIVGAEDYKNPAEGATLGDAFGSDKVVTLNPATGIKAKDNGFIVVQGWAGVDGDISAFAYKVIDADGNESAWTQLTTGFYNAEAGVNNVITNKKLGITPVSKRFSLEIDLNAYNGQVVKVVIAAVPADAPEESGDKYAYLYVLEGVNVNAEVVSQPETLPTYVHITNFGGKKDIAAQGAAIVNNTALTTSTTAAYLGRVYFTGRVAIEGTAQKLVYRLLDANGNQIQGWQELDYYGSNDYTFTDVTEGTAHLGTAQKVVPEVTNVYEYVGLANITAFPGQTVTVEFALVLDGVEGEDAYHTFATFKNVTNTQSAS